LPLMLSILFPLSLCQPKRALHSFPTRRSSDLFEIGVVHRIVDGLHRERVALLDAGRVARACLEFTGRLLRRNRHQNTPATVIVRSEEHTSELQSPCKLVCRLLLEKKINCFSIK